MSMPTPESASPTFEPIFEIASAMLPERACASSERPAADAAACAEKYASLAAAAE